MKFHLFAKLLQVEVDLDDFLIGLLRFIKKKIFINISAVTTLMGISTAANASQDMDQVKELHRLSINKRSANNLIVVAKESLGEDKYLLVKVEKIKIMILLLDQGL